MDKNAVTQRLKDQFIPIWSNMHPNAKYQELLNSTLDVKSM